MDREAKGTMLKSRLKTASIASKNRRLMQKETFEIKQEKTAKKVQEVH